MNIPLPEELVLSACNTVGFHSLAELGRATIRQFVSIVSDIESHSDFRYVRMEMGVPGLPPSQIGMDAECEALKMGVASQYPNIDGIKPFKREAKRFAKAFLNLDVPEESCIPTVGSMQGAFVSFLACCQATNKKSVLFLDPGFPVQKQQVRVMGYTPVAFDIADFRGAKMEAKLEEYLAKGDFAAVVFSNPNNPSWMCLTEEELRIVGTVAKRYHTIVVEDLAYLDMDFRTYKGTPFQPPYQPTVSHYTDQYIILLSSSKIFSYAGQRGACAIISEALFNTEFDGFRQLYNNPKFGNALIHSLLYALSAGVTHSVQYAMAAMMEAASDGRLDFVKNLDEYRRRAEKAKASLLRNGFHIVYDTDGDQQVGDGFFFTFGYKNMKGSDLVAQLLFYGISAIPLDNTGAARQGIRACVSSLSEEQFDMLDERLRKFNEDHQ